MTEGNVGGGTGMRCHGFKGGIGTASRRLDAVQVTEEAILNAMLAAETMTGADDLRVYALPVDRLMAAMRKYGRVK